jgi:acid phosphatase
MLARTRIMLGRARAILGRPRNIATVALAGATVAALAIGACGSEARQSPAQTTPSPQAQLAGSGRPHIAVIVMENSNYGDIIGSRDAPYINSLARTYALATSMYAISHPSLPNYLALTGGSTFGIQDDCTDCSVSSSGIVDQLARARIAWKAYMENLPHPCFTGPGAGNYAKRHDPFIYYDDVAHNRSRCSRIVPLTALAGDERHQALPLFSWISPNLCHDMHDCGTATGDRFLAGLIPPLLRALGPRGLLVLTWDEDRDTSSAGCCRLAGGGHVATIVAGGGARRGARIGTPVDHYSVLQTIEDLLRLPRLRGAACSCTPSLQPLLRR